MWDCKWLLAAMCAGLIGCGESPPATTGTNGPSESPPAAAPAPDAGSATSAVPKSESVTAAEVAKDDWPAGIMALEAAGAAVTRQSDGRWFINGTNARIDDAALEPLKGLNVGVLLLSETAVTDAGLRTLSEIPNLAALDLRECKITNVGLSYLTGLQQLKSLQLSGKSGATTVDDGGMEHIAKLMQLKVLGLDYLWVSEVGLEQLKPLANLERLFLSQTLVGDAATALLPQFPNLKQLRLARTQIGDEGLAPLGQLPRLEDLDLSECSQLTDAGFAHLSGLTQLRKLNVWRVQVSDAGVQHLQGLVNLESLNLDNTQFSDAGLPIVAGMPKLTFLHLGSTSVSDAGLVHLEGLTQLQELVITRTSVTEAGAAALQAKLPNLKKIQVKYTAQD